jgi:hypothetical protein
MVRGSSPFVDSTAINGGIERYEVSVQIATTDPYHDAWRLTEPAKTMPLRVTDGQHTDNGVVSEILAVTAALPKEFQNTFQPSDRNQLAKVKLAPGSQFPLNQKVSVSRPYF